MSDISDRLSASLADRYRIERELGAGGMATVYLAADLKHDRQVAIKVLKPELAAVLGAERFVQEIKTTAALQHPNILPLFDSGSADGFLYYVMPYVEGETLRARLDRIALARVRSDGTKYIDTLAATTRDGEIPFAPRVSPDGCWVAYLDARGGYWFVSSRAWVRSIDGSAAVQVSANATGGNPVVWGPDSRRLYYASTDGLVEIDLKTTPTLAGVRRRTIHSFPSLASHDYDLSPDGKTFVVAKPVNSAADVIVALHWADQARRAWSAGGIP
jgi:hypothetical protein